MSNDSDDLDSDDLDSDDLDLARAKFCSILKSFAEPRQPIDLRYYLTKKDGDAGLWR